MKKLYWLTYLKIKSCYFIEIHSHSKVAGTYNYWPSYRVQEIAKHMPIARAAQGVGARRLQLNYLIESP